MTPKIHRTPMWLVASIMLTASAAVVLSFEALAELARLLGWDGPTRWLLPISIDALGASALAAWLLYDGPVRRYARFVALVTIGLSAAFNAISHVLTGAGHVWLTVGVGSTAPVALAAAIHLGVLISRYNSERNTAAIERAERRAKAAERRPEVNQMPSAPVSPPPLRVATAQDVRDLRAELAALDARHGGPAPQRLIAAELRVGKTKAAELAKTRATG